jgi:SOS-response transcriptional repressor LexA
MTTYGQRLSEALETANKGRKDLAAAIGISVQAVGDVIRGKTVAFTAENNAKAAKFLMVSPGWLAGVEGEKALPKVQPATSDTEPGPRVRGAVPLLSSVQAGMYTEFVDNLRTGEGDYEKVPTTVPVNRYTFALRVSGDSMEPEFREGMLLVVEPELDPQPGDYVIAKNGSEETTFKQLTKDGPDWYLKPLNSRYPIKPLGDCSIIGVVRAVEKRFR